MYAIVLAIAASFFLFVASAAFGRGLYLRERALFIFLAALILVVFMALL